MSNSSDEEREIRHPESIVPPTNNRDPEVGDFVCVNDASWKLGERRIYGPHVSPAHNTHLVGLRHNTVLRSPAGIWEWFDVIGTIESIEAKEKVLARAAEDLPGGEDAWEYCPDIRITYTAHDGTRLISSLVNSAHCVFRPRHLDDRPCWPCPEPACRPKCICRKETIPQHLIGFEQFPSIDISDVIDEEADDAEDSDDPEESDDADSAS